MKALCSLAGFRLLLCLLVLPTLSAREMASTVQMAERAEAVIKVTTACDVQPEFGFMPVAVLIENQADVERSWTIDFTLGDSAYNKQASSYGLSESFSVPAKSTRERVVFVPSPASIANQTRLRLNTSGPGVKNPTSWIFLSARTAQSPAYLATTPDLETTINSLASKGGRMVRTPTRTGGKYTTLVPPGLKSEIFMTDGTVITVPDEGTPTVTRPSGAAPGAPVCETDTTRPGLVEIKAPAGVYFQRVQTRLGPTGSPSAALSSSFRNVIIHGSGPLRNPYNVYRGLNRTFVFSDGTELYVPHTGTHTVKPPPGRTSGSISVTVDAQDNLTVTMPAGVTLRRSAFNQTPTSPTSGTNSNPYMRGMAPRVVPVLSNTSVIDPSRWPADWRTWSLFSIVILDEAQWDAFEEAQRLALRDWVALGGMLVLSPVDTRAALARETLGAGQIITLIKPLKESNQEDIQDLIRGEQNPRATPWQSLGQLLTKYDCERWTLQGSGSLVMVFLLVFGITIGPVNLLLFAPAGRRHRLFLTVPLLSLSATILIVAFIVLRDGFGGSGTRRSLVVLLQGDNRAAVFQQQVSRTGLIFDSAIKMPHDALFIRELQGEDPNLGGGGGSWTLGRSGDLAEGDWFSSRARQQHQVRRIVSTRARVELIPSQAADAAPILRSSLPTTLQYLIYVDAQGREWGATEVQPGQQVALDAKKVGGFVQHLQSLAPKRKRGCFYALGGASDIAPLATLPSITWSEDSILYTGNVSLTISAAK